MSVTPFAGGPTLTISLGLNALPGGSYAIWDSSTWDSATSLWGPDFQWTDISDYVRNCTINTGRQRESDRYTGTVTLELDNRDSRFTPGNLTGPYAVGGITQLRPKIPVQVFVAYAGYTRILFQGRVETWQDDFPASGKNSVTYVTGVDLMADLAAYDGTAQSAAGAGETTGARMHRILNNAGIAGFRSIQPGVVTVQATTLAGNALSEVYLTADSEGGVVFVESGEFIFQQQTYPLLYMTTSLKTFSPTGAGSIKYSDPVMIYDTTTLRNHITYARTGGTEQTAVDLNSRAQYGDRTYGRNDLICQTDTQVATLAARDLQRWKDPEYRVASIRVQPRSNPSAYWLSVLQSFLRTRVTVEVPVSVSGFSMTKDAFVDGITHEITVNDWVVSYFFAGTAWTDVYSASLWDTGIWDTSVWN